MKSLSIRAPLSLLGASLITAFAIAVVMSVETYLNLREDQATTAGRLAHALSPMLIQALRHDDPWGAYVALRGPLTPSAGRPRDDAEGYMVLLDARGRVFASNSPARFTLNRPVDAILPALEPLANAARARQAMILRDGDQRRIAVAPLSSDDVPLGALVIGFARGEFWQRFLEISVGGSIAVGLVLLIILPIGWTWSRRMVAPLTELAQCMGRVGHEPLEKIECPISGGDDEIGELAKRFNGMLVDLRSMQALERELKSQERLAAIGRLAGGVAHEINNPLGGMLVAIDTFRQRPPHQRDPDRTMAFIERALRQIQETVAALLVECRLEARNLQAADIDDLKTLASSDEAAAAVAIEWRNGLHGELCVPATPVRQIILNLVLNAMQSAPGGRVAVSVTHAEGRLSISVGDDGPPVPQGDIERIFEPYHSNRPGGTGLGLWVTYETVRQMQGQIAVDSGPDWTTFAVSMPVADSPPASDYEAVA